jgi:hypothetical protein
MFWMAPEVLVGADYNALVDVYSYAMILYELAAEKIPFEGLNVNQFVHAIANSYRPKLPDDTPKCLRALIDLCWDNDPNQRPNFSRIYALFESKIVYFNNTDMDQIDNFIDFINRKTAKEPEEEERHDSTRNELDVTFESIVNPVKPVSPQTLAEYVGRMNYDQCIILVEKFYDYMKGRDVSDAVMFAIYNAVLLITQRGSDYVKILASSNLPSVLSFDGPTSYQFAFKILYEFVSQTPEFCPTDILDKLMNSQLKRYPHLVMCSLSHYFKYIASNIEIQTEKNIIEFFTSFIEKCSVFIEIGEVPEYLRIINEVISGSDPLLEIERELIQGSLELIFKADLTKKNTHDINAHAIYYAYRFVISQSFKKQKFFVTEMDSHTRDSMLRPVVASYLVSLTVEDGKLPPLPMKTSRLISSCAEHSDSRLLTLMYANTDNGAKDLSESNDIWEYKETIPPEWYIRLFLILSTRQNSRERILSNKRVYSLFAKLSELHIPEVTKTICTIFRKLPSTIMNPTLIKYLNEKDFWGHTIKCLMESDNIEDQKECLSVLAFHAPTYITDQMAKIYPYLGEVISDSSPTCLHALSVMQPFMIVPQIRKKFEDKGYIEKIRSLRPTPNSKPYIQSILGYYT